MHTSQKSELLSALIGGICEAQVTAVLIRIVYHPVVLLRLLNACRLRLRILQRQSSGLPAVGAVRIPRNILITQRQRSLGGVPRHPAVTKAIKNQQFCAVALRDSF